MIPFSSHNSRNMWFRPGQILFTGSYSYEGAKERSVRGEPRRPHPFHKVMWSLTDPRPVPNGVDSVGCYYPHDMVLIRSQMSSLLSNTQADLSKNIIAMSADWEKLMPTQVSLGNFVRELAEMLPMFVFLPLRFAQVHRLVASAYLAWEFGWGPFWDDINKLAKLNDAMLKRVLFLMSAINAGNQGVTVKAFRVTTLPLGTPKVVDSPHLQWLYEPLGDGGPRHYTFKHSLVHRCSGRLVTSLSYMDLCELYEAGTLLKQALGLLDPAPAFWNALPKSFMVDWVAPIQPIMKKIAAANQQELTVDRFTHSISLSTTCVPSVYCPVPGHAYDEGLLPNVILVGRHYQRLLGVPPLELSLGGPLSPKRLAILLALLATYR